MRFEKAFYWKRIRIAVRYEKEGIKREQGGKRKAKEIFNEAISMISLWLAISCFLAHL